MWGIYGASGSLGFYLYNYLKRKNERVMGTYSSHSKPGLTKFNILNDNFSVFRKCKRVILSGGITNVTQCYKERESAHFINVVKMIELIKYLTKHKIKPIFLSSEAVFDGEIGVYSEYDIPRPLNYYGLFKLLVENFMVNTLKNYTIFRLCQMYTADLRYETIFKEVFTKLSEGKEVMGAVDLKTNLTSYEFIGEKIQALKDKEGLWHIGNPLVQSRYEFACSIAKKFGFDDNLVKKVNYSDFNMTEKRALDSSLNVGKMLHTLYTPKSNIPQIDYGSY